MAVTPFYGGTVVDVTRHAVAGKMGILSVVEST
jgi:hypothetical protein